MRAYRGQFECVRSWRACPYIVWGQRYTQVRTVYNNCGIIRIANITVYINVIVTVGRTMSASVSCGSKMEASSSLQATAFPEKVPLRTCPWPPTAMTGPTSNWSIGIMKALLRGVMATHAASSDGDSRLFLRTVSLNDPMIFLRMFFRNQKKANAPMSATTRITVTTAVATGATVFGP